MRLVRVAIQEEDIARADRARKEDGGGGVEKCTVCAEGVVGDNELALATVERDRARRLREGESALGGRDCEGERDIGSTRRVGRYYKCENASAPSTKIEHVLRSRIGLPGDEELSAGVRVL